MAADFISHLRNLGNYAQGLSSGEKSASKLTSDLNHWLKESGETLKEKIESEIESAAIRMGFVRKEELEKLEKRIEKLESGLKKDIKAKRVIKKAIAKKTATVKRVAK